MPRLIFEHFLVIVVLRKRRRGTTHHTSQPAKRRRQEGLRTDASGQVNQHAEGERGRLCICRFRLGHFDFPEAAKRCLKEK